MFYCSVKVSANGPFLDPRILASSFLSAARAEQELIEAIRRVSAACHPHFQRQFEMLVNVLESKV